MAAGMTHSQLATKLIVEGCLAHIAGNVQGKMPVAPIPLTELERADIGLKQGGHTVFYPLPPTGVFFDMHGANATVWFNEADAGQGLGALEAAMKSAHPRSKQLKDEPHPTDRALRARSYEVDLGGSRLALLQVEYPAPGGQPKLFRTRVVAQKRK